MQKAAQIGTLIELVEQVIQFTTPADQVFSTYMRERRYIGAKDRKQLGAWLYGILRHYGRLSYYADDARAFVLAFLRLYAKSSVDEILSYFNADGYGPKPLPKIVRTWLMELEPVADMPDHLKYECPEWLWHDLNDRLLVLEALQKEAPCDIRVNSLKAKRHDVLRALLEEGIVTETLSSDYGLRIQGRHNVTSMPAFLEGQFEIQDLGSQAVITLAQAKPGETVIDLCAGGGGKTLGLAADMKNKGKLLVCDIIAWKLKNAEGRLKRAGVHNAQILLLDDEGQKKLKRQKDQADLVLVDAPCSGTGTWRRNPDLRWRFQQKDLNKVLKIQEKLLEQAANLVRPGGRLVYATCSLLPAENERQIEAFLKSNLDFSPSDKINLCPPSSDGFFAQVLVKNKSSTPKEN